MPSFRSRTGWILPLACSLSMIATFVDVKPATAQKPFRVGEIGIVGNKYTPDSIIRRQLHFYPGNKATLADLNRVKLRLRRRLLWRNPRVVAIRDPNQPGWADIVVIIEEREVNFWLFNVGYEFAVFQLTSDFQRLNYVGLRLRNRFRDCLRGR